MSEVWLLPPLAWETFCLVPLVSGFEPGCFLCFPGNSCLCPALEWLPRLWPIDHGVISRDPSFPHISMPWEVRMKLLFLKIFSWLLSCWLRKPKMPSSHGTGHFHLYFHWFLLLCALKVNQHARKEENREGMAFVGGVWFLSLRDLSHGAWEWFKLAAGLKRPGHVAH